MSETAEEKKNRILDVSIGLFFTNGYQATTTREIAEASGMERGHLYYYYRKKEDILFGWYTRLLSGVYEAVMKKYGRIDDAYLLISILDTIYYRLLFSEEKILDLLLSVLANRHLCQLKADKTCEFYLRLFEETGTEVSDEKVRRVLSVVIGAEAELLHDKTGGRIDMGFDEITELIIDLQLYMFGFGNGRSAELRERTFELADRFDGYDELKKIAGAGH